MNRLLKTTLTLGLLSAMLLGQGMPTWADGEDAFQFFQDEAKVVTASRQEQPIQEVPAAVDVITPEEIKASGATNLADLLRFRVGMDVLDARSVDGNRAIVSDRGFPQEFVNNLQVLVDGRSVYEPVASEVFWDQLPVQMQDIERIEIIRGPNAVLYGSGAGLGVINIITKKPQGPTEAEMTTEGGNRGDVQTSESFESSTKDFAYRASYTYRQSNGAPSASGVPIDDLMSGHQANVRTNWTPRDGSDVELFAGGSWNQEGVPTIQISGDTFDQNFQMVKFSQKLGDHSTIEAISSRNQYINQLNNSQVWQYDEELLHQLDWWGDRMNTTYGINYRGATADSALLFGPVQGKEDLWSGYLHQTMKVSKTFSLDGGFSLETDDVGSGGLESNYQAASLWSPLENNTFRASYGVSHAVPSLFDALANYQSTPSTLVIGDPTIRPEKLTSYEIGHYAAVFDQHLIINSSLYYTVIADMNNSFVQSAAFVPSPQITLAFGNVDQAISRGFETEFKYRFDRGHSLFVNYSYEHISDQAGDAGDVTQNTPAHKVNFGGIADLGHGFSGSVNVGYKDNYLIDSDGYNSSAAIPAYWRLDARIAYAVNPRVELFVSGQNLAVSTHEEFPDGLVVPRTYQGGVSVKFGAHP